MCPQRYVVNSFTRSNAASRLEGGTVTYRLIPAAVLVLITTLSGYTQSQPSYGKDQADKGKLLYSRSCSRCHLDNLRGNCPAENLSSTSYICAAAGSARDTR